MEALVAHIITSPIFRDVGIPIITFIVTVVLKLSSRREVSLKWEDFDIGLDLMVISMTLLLMHIVNIGFQTLSPSASLAELTATKEFAALAKSVTSDECTTDMLGQMLLKLHTIQAVQSEPQLPKMAIAACFLVFLFFLSVGMTIIIRGVRWDRRKSPNHLAILVPTIVGLATLIKVSQWINPL